MMQPPSKMTSEIPQRCAKSSSENDAIIFNTFFEICCPPSPVESFNFSGWFVFFTISVIISIIIYFRSLIIPIFGNPWPQPSWRPEAAKCRLGSAEWSWERFWRSCFGLTFGRVVVCATISEKTFGTGEGRQLTSAAVRSKLVQVHPATGLYMYSVGKSTVLMGQRALRYMRVFCISWSNRCQEWCSHLQK